MNRQPNARRAGEHTGSGTDPASIREAFLNACARGLDAATTAHLLSTPIDQVNRWLRRMELLEAQLLLPAGSYPQELRDSPAPAGITLIHTADVPRLAAGQTVSFTVWIMNDTNEPLNNISLTRWPVTDPGNGQPDKDTESDETDLNLATLHPGHMTTHVFTYQLTARDLTHGPRLVTTIGVQATTHQGKELRDTSHAVMREME